MRRFLLPLSLCLPLAATAAEDDSAFFESRVRPVLAEHCVECHGPTEQRGGLRLDTREHLLAGGDDGAVAVPGDPDRSPLVRAVRHQTERPMPDKKPALPPAQVEALAEWVRRGMPWPQSVVIAPVEIAEKARRHWAYQPVRATPPPRAPEGSLVRTAIDGFLQAAIERQGLRPAPRLEDRRVFLRRAAALLTGLPPSEADAAALLARDGEFDAWADQVVDHYLASPHYGERWGRLWLDVARYADNKGYVFQENRDYPYAYTYRDWVVRAFNDDLPFADFVQRQLAADRLPLPVAEQAALGFLTVGRRFINDQQLIIDDRIDVVSRGLMGATLACARCHDHKSDPFTMKDYYGLYGIFSSSHEPDDKPLIAPPGDSPAARAFAEELRKKAEEIHAYAAEKIPDYARPGNPFEFDERRFSKLPKPERDHVRGIMNKMTEMEAASPHAPPRAMAMVDKDKPANARVLLRGSRDRPGDEAPRAFPAFLRRPDQPAFTDGSGRLELAREITRPDNPLTHRVWVNRVWAQMMGRGLVDSMSDFGLQTPPPSHPELLDWMTAAFLEHGGSTRWLVREIARSAAWRRSAIGDDASAAADPDNRLYARFNRRRLDFEGFRDAVLAASGRLDPAVGGRPVKLEDADTRRTLYTYIDRQNLPAVFRTFDFANPDTHAPRRFITTTPTQALFALNSPFMLEQALHLARRAREEAGSGDAARLIDRLYRRSLSRSPTAEERDAALAFLREADAARPTATAWSYGYGFAEGDPERVSFTALPVFFGGVWQAGPRMPDPALHYVALKADGGHPGADARHAAILRWTAPADLEVTISGELRRTTAQGDSVLARLVSSRQGRLAEWKAVKQQKVATAAGPLRVQAGETLDFLVDPDGDHSHDGFTWAPVILEELHLLWNARRNWPVPGKPTAWTPGLGSLDAEGRVAFQPFGHYDEAHRRWQAAGAFPDATHGHACWGEGGAHPGPDERQATVLRWTAPKAGRVSVSGELRRVGGCDGTIRARLVHGRLGKQGEWKVAQQGRQATAVSKIEVQAGDTLDFVVDADGPDTCDSFTWPPEVRMEGPAPRNWDARRDFRGEDLDARAQLAQVLLMSNEFLFVD